MMRGEKENPYDGMDWEVMADWPWAQPTYSVQLDVPKEQIKAVLIDPSQLMADVDPQNNAWQQE